jgi:hypothetical protein
VWAALAVVAVVALLAGPGLAILDGAGPGPADRASDRTTAGGALLGRLGSALAAGDPTALAALADPDAPAASRELAMVADNLRDLRVSDLTLRYVDDSGIVLSAEQQAALGERAWIADVEVIWQLPGADPGPSRLEVPVALDWDGDRAVFRTARISDGRRSPLWLLDRVAVRRTPRAWVIASGGADAQRLLRHGSQAATTIRSAVPAWRGVLVVEAAATSDQFLAVTGLDEDAAQVLAAVTTTTDGSQDPRSPTHVYVNLPVFDDLGPVGRQVVLSHEAVHVALGSPTRAVPVWLSEGIADHIALADSRTPVTETAAQILELVRDDGPPRRLPSDADFERADPDIGAWYEAAWVAVRLIAETYGESELLEFYRLSEQDRGTERAFTEVLGTTEEAFVERWRDELVALAR